MRCNNRSFLQFFIAIISCFFACWYGIYTSSDESANVRNSVLTYKSFSSVSLLQLSSIPSTCVNNLLTDWHQQCERQMRSGKECSEVAAVAKGYESRSEFTEEWNWYVLFSNASNAIGNTFFCRFNHKYLIDRFDVSEVEDSHQLQRGVHIN